MSVFRYDEVREEKRLLPRVLFGLAILVVVVLGGGFFWYNNNIQPLDPNNTEQQIITVNQGASEASVSMTLKENDLIKSSLAFQVYIRVNGKQGELQAGGYRISKSMPVAEIVDKLTGGEVAVDLVTILPANRLDQIEETFREAGYGEEEIIEALSPGNHKDHPVLQDKPALANLEGYLYPESFNKTTETPLEFIIRASLDQLELALTSDIIEQFEKQNLSVHDGIILSSIVEREVSNTDDKPIVAQVFLKRLREGLPLGSDPTALYGALINDMEPSVFADTPYNTRIYEGLPPGPINNVSADSLKAVAYPADTSYLFFVSGDDGNTYYSNTLQDHEALTQKHCIELCSSY